MLDVTRPAVVPSFVPHLSFLFSRAVQLSEDDVREALAGYVLAMDGCCIDKGPLRTVRFTDILTIQITLSEKDATDIISNPKATDLQSRNEVTICFILNEIHLFQ